MYVYSIVHCSEESSLGADCITAPSEYGGHFIPVHVVSMKYSRDSSEYTVLSADSQVNTNWNFGVLLLECLEVMR